MIAIENLKTFFLGNNILYEKKSIGLPFNVLQTILATISRAVL
jgi:hypothetical protein